MESSCALLGLLSVLQVGAPARPRETTGAPTAVLIDREGATTRHPLSAFRTSDLAGSGAVVVQFEGAERARWDADAAELGKLGLTSGDTIFGRVLGGSGDAFRVEILGGVAIDVAIDDVASLVFEGRIPAAWTSPLGPSQEGDRLYRRQADGLDQLDGTVQELTPEGVRFHGVLGNRVLAWPEIAALWIEPLEDDAERRAGPRPGGVVVDLLDNSRLRGRLELLSSGGCRIRRGADEAVDLPIAAIASIAVDDGSVAFLSDLEPVEADAGSPFGDDLGMRWPYRRDRSVTGAPLAAGGAIHTRGIGVHAPSRLVFRLDGGWRALRGRVAIDDQVLLLAARGSVAFKISVDGKVRWQSAVVRGGDPPLEIPSVSLEKARELVLEVDPAADAFVADRADWLGMMLVK